MGDRVSIVILMDPNSAGCRKAVLATAKSACAHCSSGDDSLEIVALLKADDLDDGRKIISKIGKEYDRKIDIASDQDINDKLTGDVVFILKEGATVKAGDIKDMADAAEQADCMVIEPKRDNKDKLFASGYISIHAKYQVIGGIPENIMIKRSDRIDFGAFIRGGIDAREQLMMALMYGEGAYYYKELEIAYEGAKDVFEVPDAEGVIRRLIEVSLSSEGYVCEFVQNYIMKILALKMDEHAHIEDAKGILENVSDEIICINKYMDLHQAIYLLSKKYGCDVRDELYVTDAGKFMFRDLELGGINTAIHIRVSVSSIVGNRLILEGMTDIPYYLGNHYKLCASGTDNKPADLKIMPLKINDQAGFDGEKCFSGEQYRVEFEIPESGSDTFTIYLQDENDRRIMLFPRMGANSKLNSKLPVSYFRSGGYLVRCELGEFQVSRYTKKLHRKYEREYMKELLDDGRRASVLYRLLYYIDRHFQKKPVWLVMDRPHLAKDNGEHMFRYLETTDAAKDNDIYFVLKKSSRDYERLKKVGKVLVHNSLKHRIKYLEAEFLIAAAANNLTVNAFGKSGVYYRDLYNFDFVYLRHGVSHNDQSAWLHKLKKNMRVLVATCKPEYNGILEGGYGYTEREVKLTGLARYDNLYDDKKKIIAILPTWRQNLEGELMYRSSKRAYIPGFKDTDYYKFYNSLINNEKLLKVMKDNGYTGVFYLHPVFEAQFKDFKGNDIIKVGNGVADYQQVFKESALMVTDFSSVAFDFAYLKKPVIYSQFDEETFYKYHTWGKGYFTYREDGFGPITNTLDDTVNTLIEYIQTGCQMKPEYVEKVDNFFAYTDRNNCKRIYEAILEAREENNRER